MINRGTWITVAQGMKVIRIERMHDCWRLWESANQDFSCGTFVSVCDDGSAERVYVDNTREETFTIKQKDES